MKYAKIINPHDMENYRITQAYCVVNVTGFKFFKWMFGNWKMLINFFDSHKRLNNKQPLYEKRLTIEELIEEHDYQFNVTSKVSDVSGVNGRYILNGEDHLSDYFRDQLEGPAIILANYSEDSVYPYESNIYWKISLFNPNDILKVKLILGSPNNSEYNMYENGVDKTSGKWTSPFKIIP